MSALSERLRWLGRRLALSWVLFIVVGVVVGLLLAPQVFTMAADPGGTVAIVPVEGGIDGSGSAAFTAMLQEARADPDIDAVVLLANSPGGSAAASEQMYLEVSRLATQMPVVASVDAMAASGAYYTIAPADYVYAKPSSLVGSVGVFTTAPADVQPIDDVIASGPEKLSGGSVRDWQHKTESLRQAFVGAVFQSRGDRLSISRREVSKAGLYTGAQAVQNGMVDGIGGSAAAVRRAANEAGLDDYDVTVLRPENATISFLSRSNYLASNAEHKELVDPSYFVGHAGENPATANILMLPPSVIAAAFEDSETSVRTPTASDANRRTSTTDSNSSQEGTA